MRECEEMLKIVQGCRELRLELAGDSRLASRQNWHACEACRGAEESFHTHLKKQIQAHKKGETPIKIQA